MDKSLEQYVHLGVGLVVAVATMGMFGSMLTLRREAQVVLENKQYVAEVANLKRRFDDFNGMQVSSAVVVSLITQFADELDIYVKGTGRDSTETMLVDNSNRYLYEYLNPTNAEIKAGLGLSGSVTTNMYTLAREYGIISAQCIGSFFYGDGKWVVQTVFDNKDVSKSSSTTPDTARSEVTGLRIIKQ